MIYTGFSDTFSLTDITRVEHLAILYFFTESMKQNQMNKPRKVPKSGGLFSLHNYTIALISTGGVSQLYKQSGGKTRLWVSLCCDLVSLSKSSL